MLNVILHGTFMFQCIGTTTYDNSFNPPNYVLTLRLGTFSLSMVKYTRKYSQLCKKWKCMKIPFENMFWNSMLKNLHMNLKFFLSNVNE